MRLLLLFSSLSLFFPALAAQDCTELLPQLGQVGQSLAARFDKDICGQDTGDAQDYAWIGESFAPMIVALIGNGMPKDAWRDIHKLVQECRLDTYEYCKLGDRIAMEKCAKRRVPVYFPKSRVLKLMPAMCPAVQNILGGWPGKYEQAISQLFSRYCETRGKTC